MLQATKWKCRASAVVVITYALSGCIDPHAICGLSGTSEWSYLRKEPSDAAELRTIAAKRRLPVMPAGDKEYWFKNAQGHVQLCYSSLGQTAPVINHYSLEFWRDNGQLRIRDASEFINE